MPIKIVGCLQNVWFYPHVHEERCRDYRYWHRAFCRSRSGRRLFQNLGPDVFNAMTWENASPQIGRESGAKFPADPTHIKRWLKKHEPHMVVAFGEVAEVALRELWKGCLVAVPHPASRLVTNNLFMSLRDMIATERDNPQNEPLRVALRQARGTVVLDCVDYPSYPHRVGSQKQVAGKFSKP